MTKQKGAVARDRQTAKRRCIFCGGPANSREHAIAEWLSKRMGIRDLGFHPGHFSEHQGLKLRPLIKCEHLVTKQVCQACNNNWMSELEAWAQQHFGGCVEATFQPHQLTQLESIRSQSGQMVRWLLKTAIILERALPQGEMIKVVPSLFPIARGTDKPTDFHVWAAYIYNKGFNLHVLRGFSVWNGGILQPYQVHAESMNFGIQFNHLALLLFRCPLAHPWVKGHIIQPGGVRSIPLCITQEVRCTFPHNHIYPNLESFMGALEICADPPQDKEITQG